VNAVLDWAGVCGISLGTRAQQPGLLMADDVLLRLADTIAARRHAEAGTSYTQQLLEAGPARCARKFGEESVETIVAALDGSPEQLTAEAADVLYHLLVLLEVRGVAVRDVLGRLEARMGTSGLAEKASRVAP
jgi:phosphoribosyl-ATP pyrophosphohydrolase